jgi:hypothetical protein
MREWCLLEVIVSMELGHKNEYCAISYSILKHLKAHSDVTLGNWTYGNNWAYNNSIVIQSDS